MLFGQPSRRVCYLMFCDDLSMKKKTLWWNNIYFSDTTCNFNVDGNQNWCNILQKINVNLYKVCLSNLDQFWMWVSRLCNYGSCLVSFKRNGWWISLYGHDLVKTHHCVMAWFAAAVVIASFDLNRTCNKVDNISYIFDNIGL